MLPKRSDLNRASDCSKGGVLSKADNSAKVRSREVRALHNRALFVVMSAVLPFSNLSGHYIASEFKLKTKKKTISLWKIIFLFCTVILSPGHTEHNLSQFRRNYFSISGSMRVLKLESISAGA